MKTIAISFLLFFLYSCSIYSFKATNAKNTAIAENEKILEPIKVNIHFYDSSLAEREFARNWFIKEFTYQFIKKKIKFILVDSDSEKDKGLYVDLSIKEKDNGAWRPWVVFFTLAIIPMKIVTTYEVETNVSVDGKFKENFVLKSGYESWTQILLLLAGPFTEFRDDIDEKVFEDLANQLVVNLQKYDSVIK